jgi:hypothetical protein
MFSTARAATYHTSWKTAPQLQMGTVIHCALVLLYPISLNMVGMKYEMVKARQLAAYKAKKKYVLPSFSTETKACSGVRVVLPSSSAQG